MSNGPQQLYWVKLQGARVDGGWVEGLYLECLTLVECIVDRSCIGSWEDQLCDV